LVVVKQRQDRILLIRDGLGELIVRNEQRLKFTADYKDAKKFLESAQAVFHVLADPEKDGTGETNLTIYESACEELAGALANRNGGKQDNYVLVVNKSTVPIRWKAGPRRY